MAVNDLDLHNACSLRLDKKDTIKYSFPPQVYYSASLQKQRIQDAMTQGLYEKTRDSQEVQAVTS